MQRLLLILLNWVLPERLLSRLVGHLTRLHAPGFLLHPVMRWYVKHFRVDLSEAAKPLEEYPTFVDFFTRELKPGLRPLEGGEQDIISPVDGAVYACGPIEEGAILQAKGRTYSVASLLDDPVIAERYHHGTFLTIYLSPRDYHRLHTPLAAEVQSFRYIPGKLLPVNPPSVAMFHGLFAKNERLVTYLHNPDFGQIAYVKVGATNVGRIRLSYQDFVTNRWGWPKAQTHVLEEPIAIERGGELGMFEMGSTVILLFEPGVSLVPLEPHQPLRLGQKIGHRSESTEESVS